jgi:uncharacterized membrane protein
MVLVLAALLAVPAAAAAVSGFQADVGLRAGERHSWRLDGHGGDGVVVSWDGTAPVDVLVLQADNASVLDDPAMQPARAGDFLNLSQGQGHATLAGNGPWLLIVDNSPQPPGGAAGDQPVTVHVSVVPNILEVAPQPQPAQAGQGAGGEAPTLWNTLLFDAPHWAPGGVVGFSGMALWMIVLSAAAMYGFATPARRLAELTVLVAAATILWSLLPHPGVLTQIGVPLALGFAAGWMAVRRSRTLADCARLAFVASVFGVFAGVILAFGARNLWTRQPMLVLGADQFQDVLFTLPMGALLGVVLLRLVPDVVHAIEEANHEGAEAVPATPGQGDAFLVTCLRCATEIKVERSMKRFRVATDRFEFACPNCQYWMEWADPAQKHGAAAA